MQTGFLNLLHHHLFHIASMIYLQETEQAAPEVLQIAAAILNACNTIIKLYVLFCVVKQILM